MISVRISNSAWLFLEPFQYSNFISEPCICQQTTPKTSHGEVSHDATTTTKVRQDCVSGFYTDIKMSCFARVSPCWAKYGNRKVDCTFPEFSRNCGGKKIYTHTLTQRCQANHWNYFIFHNSEQTSENCWHSALIKILLVWISHNKGKRIVPTGCSHHCALRSRSRNKIPVLKVHHRQWPPVHGLNFWNVSQVMWGGF